jgi:hypothetical protein
MKAAEWLRVPSVGELPGWRRGLSNANLKAIPHTSLPQLVMLFQSQRALSAARTVSCGPTANNPR